MRTSTSASIRIGTGFSLSLILVFFQLIPTFPAQAASDKSAPTRTMGVIDAEATDKLSIVNVRFSGSLEKKEIGEIENHGYFLQVKIPNMIVPDPGKFYESKSPHIKKLAAIQTSETDAALRIFVDKKVKNLQGAAKLEVLGSRLVITFDHQKFAPAVAKNTKNPTPADLIKGTAATTAVSTRTGGIDLREKLVQVSIFCGILLFAFVIMMVSRPLWKKAKFRTEFAEPVKMKTISSLQLAAKQKLSLVQVGEEKFLLGVTPENINLITSLNDSQAVAQNTRARSSYDTNTENPPIHHTQVRVPQQVSEQHLRQATPNQGTERPTSRMSRKAKKNFTKLIPKAKTDSVKLKKMPAKQQQVATTQNSNPIEQRSTAPTNQRINVSISDEGITEHLNHNRPSNPKTSKNSTVRKEPMQQRAIDDVTKLIRQKLSDLKKI